ncbi:hypothetical protein BC834DRAFT_326502 [Gloeopeniophorella convolvens]|nr:hypothetical protein BC834DRAFT_326502 [Gloeopeniophorella convolvens]
MQDVPNTDSLVTTDGNTHLSSSRLLFGAVHHGRPGCIERHWGTAADQARARIPTDSSTQYSVASRACKHHGGSRQQVRSTATCDGSTMRWSGACSMINQVDEIDRRGCCRLFRPPFADGKDATPYLSRFQSIAFASQLSRTALTASTSGSARSRAR